MRGQLPGARNRFSQRLALIDKARALRPDLRGKLVGCRLRRGLVAVGHHQHAQAGRRDIRQPEAGQHRHCQHAIGLGLPGRRHRALHRAFARIAAQRVRDHRQAPPGQRGPRLLLEHAHQQAAGMLAGFVHVHVRVGLEADRDVGMLDHLLRDIAVQVERDGDRHVGQHCAQPLEKVALAVVAVLRHHGAVQVQHHRVAAGRRVDDGIA